MFDYKLLEALAAVVQEGGFDKAARKMHITQSAVSQRVKLLEDQAGRVLLVRGTPPRPTPTGRKMLTHYIQVRRLEEDLQAEMDQKTGRGFSSLALGINADSLATWFMEVIPPFLLRNRVVVDIRIDDQEQTHRLLKNGGVLGCISTQEQAMQGCRMAYLGRMNYRLLASPEFAAQWFPGGLTSTAVGRAPALLFNRQDEMNRNFFKQALIEAPEPVQTHYLPSSETFVEFITSGLAYGILPDQQSSTFIQTGRLIDLAPGHFVPVKLYWHCRNLKSSLLEDLTGYLVEKTKTFLEE